MKDKLLPLIAVGFPGGYKFFIVLLVTTFSGDMVANEFSKIFFWVALLVTFTGLPIASLMISTEYNISGKDKVTLVLISTMISFFIAHYIELNKYTLSVNVFVFISVLFLSSYEIVKQYFLNLADFVSIFIASSSTLVLFVFLFSVSSDNAGYILFFCYISLLLPIIFLYIFQKQKNILNYSTLADVFKGFFKYLVSNAASTSLMFAIPIVIIAELGDEVAADLAQIFYFSTLSYLIPRALSAKHIPNMRNKGIANHEVKNFFMTIFTFVVVAIGVALPLFYYFYEQWLVYILLFVAMQLSQLSLPFSNVLMVKGDVNTILKINLSSMLVFLIASLSIYYLFDKGVERGDWLLVTFCCYQLLKLHLGFIKSKIYLHQVK